MKHGRVYLWVPDSQCPLGGRILVAVVPLPRLKDQVDGGLCLSGRHVVVHNGGAINELDPVSGGHRAVNIGDARPDAEGNFLFEPSKGGGRLDKVVVGNPDFRWRYIQASHFGEVNTYYHLDAIAAYVSELLGELRSQGLPRVAGVVNAHHAATERVGVRDGVLRSGRWLPFQGGHYRLPSRRYDVAEHQMLSPDGEIHLGPGWRLLDHGALVEAAGGRYRANASHNAGILYHEYGHHICRHTADLRGNAWRRPDRQNNRKSALEEGLCDYWAATMLQTPHIWAWHRRHDEIDKHPRSLKSIKTMADFDHGPGADPHANGTIWASALWDMRTRLWNRRCAATARLPGSAMDTAQALEADIQRLRECVDRLVVVFHWGVPYVREPSAEDRAKARWAIDCGADAVLGHHPHVIQPLEIYRARPIFYSVGNFAMGTGNSRAEGLAIGLRFEHESTVATVVPLYVKNRDPRVAYQPKVLRGPSAERILAPLSRISEASGARLERNGDWGCLDIPRSETRLPASEVGNG